MCYRVNVVNRFAKCEDDFSRKARLHSTLEHDGDRDLNTTYMYGRLYLDEKNAQRDANTARWL